MDKKTKDIWNYFSSNYYNAEEYNQIKTIDFAGCEMIKSAYGDENSNYNWTIDHIFPKNSSFAKVFGSNDITNCQVASLETNQQKANKLAGTIQINYYYNNRFQKTVYTKFEVKENFFFNSKSNREQIGIIFIKEQWDSNGRVFIKNKYFYDSILFSFSNNILYYHLIDLEKSLNDNAIILYNRKFECPRDKYGYYEIPKVNN